MSRKFSNKSNAIAKYGTLYTSELVRMLKRDERLRALTEKLWDKASDSHPVCGSTGGVVATALDQGWRVGAAEVCAVGVIAAAAKTRLVLRFIPIL